jgi:predicted RNase H-like HicB family nuclease
MIDYRKLLKDCIRGMRVDWEVPAVPLSVDARGEAIDSTREELELFFELVLEVVAEEGERRPSVLRDIVELEREYLG